MILHGDCREVLQGIEPVDAVVTDPPYGLKFMGAEWDKGVPGAPYWKAIQNAMKPGAYLAAFGGTRTYHRLACAIEDAGFELRDCLMWLYGSGFPKSRDLGGGYGTALKPAWEPILLARKPFKGTATNNWAKHGTGGINIESCRVATTDDTARTQHSQNNGGSMNDGQWVGGTTGGGNGRWPSNVVLSHAEGCQQLGTKKVKGITGGETVVRRSGVHSEAGGHQTIGRVQPSRKGHSNPDGTETVEAWDCVEGCPVRTLDEQSGHIPASFRQARSGEDHRDGLEFALANNGALGHQDSGGASRFFYCTKASRKERERGLGGRNGKRRNTHPTVKPIDLMRWLVRLVTPPDGVVLDPFAGSGTTLIAAHREGFRSVGVELDEGHYKIAERRIMYSQMRD